VGPGRRRRWLLGAPFLHIVITRVSCGVNAGALCPRQYSPTIRHHVITDAFAAAAPSPTTTTRHAVIIVIITYVVWCGAVIATLAALRHHAAVVWWGGVTPPLIRFVITPDIHFNMGHSPVITPSYITTIVVGQIFRRGVK